MTNHKYFHFYNFHVILHNIVFQLAYLFLLIVFDYQIFTDKYLI